MRCVDADALMNSFCNDCQGREYCKKYNNKCSSYEDLKEMLDNAPIINIESPEQSEWRIEYSSVTHTRQYICKNCGHREPCYKHYCGGCGCEIIGADYK